MRQKAPKAPGHYDKVFKDECMFSFDTPFSPEGLYVNLHTWQAFGAEYVTTDASKSGNSLYLRQRAHKVILMVPSALDIYITAWTHTSCIPARI